METLAIFLLALVLAVGVMVMVIFLRFLRVAGDNQRMFREIMERLSSLSARIDALPRAPGLEREIDEVD